MNVVVKIAGREALPVWALPYVTSWHLSPDALLLRLVNPQHDQTNSFPGSFNLGAHNEPFPLPPEQWEGVLVQIKSLDAQLRSDEKDAIQNYNDWRNKHSIGILRKYRAYVWLDEFEKWFDKELYAWKRFDIDENAPPPINEADFWKLTEKPGLKLCLSPLLDEARANESEWFKVIGDSELAKERRKGTAQIKASRVTKFKFSNQALLDSHLSELIQKAGLQNANEFDYSWNLYVWEGQLADELKSIKRSDYPNKRDYDDRIRALNFKIREIEQSLDDYGSPTETATSIPTLEYGEAELSPSDAIGLYPALKILGDDWTAEEFALQVFYGGIRAFEQSKVDGTLRLVLNIPDWLIQHGWGETCCGEIISIKKVLLRFNYSKSELSQLKPEYRYLSYQQALTCVSKFLVSLEDAEEFLIDAIERHKIIAFHPFVGTVTPELSMNGGRWLKSYFQDWKLTKLLSQEFRDLEATNNELNTVMNEVTGSQRNNQAYVREGVYGERDEDAANWLQDGNPNINNMTNPEIRRALITRNKDLWSKGFEDWNREQKVWPKKQRGRKKGK